MASLENQFRVVAEVAAAATAVTAAEIIGTADEITSAQERLERANLAMTAIVDGPTELADGQPVLWINTFGANDGDPIGILEARILGEIVPRGMTSDLPERHFLALVEDPPRGHVERVVGENDILALPNLAHTPDHHAEHGSGTDVADLVRDAFGDSGPMPDGADTDPPPPSPPEPDTGYGLDSGE